jgi:hypothetical protein
MMAGEICRDDARRALTRRAELNGIDYVEVEPNLKNLRVFFLGPAPSVESKNVRIEGEPRARPVQLANEPAKLPGRDDRSDDYLLIELEAPGDASTYTLSFVEEAPDGARDADGAPRLRPLTGFDPFYYRCRFSFHAACPSDLDCRKTTACPPATRAVIPIDYVAKDYASLRRLMLDRLALTLPEWKERHVPDLGITLVELLAYVGDHLSYFQDSVATEAYLDTARRRISVRRHARLVDYALHEGCNARAFVCVETSADYSLPARGIFFTTGSSAGLGSGLLSEDDLAVRLPAGSFECFEPVFREELTLHAAHNEIRFYTWGNRECCLPRGATRATLLDPGAGSALASEATHAERQPALALATGDVLIFEEILGPKTGDPADADAEHRHAVRLTSTERRVDPVTGALVLDIEWSEEDALPFPLCVSTLGPAPVCAYLDPVSVARGNVILVDHGRTQPREPLGEPPVTRTPLSCLCEGLASEAGLERDRFNPVLSQRQLTFAEPVAQGVAAARACVQDPRRALPAVTLESQTKRALDGQLESLAWTARPDLLGSGPADRDFVVEVDDDRNAVLRFGNGRQGRAPGSEVPSEFVAEYRVGNGAQGNVGAEAIRHLVTRGRTISGLELRVRNPLSARGGVEPEPCAEAKLKAPRSFAKRLERAITADDYARIAEREFPAAVQRAAGSLRWNGSWYEAMIAVDARGRTEPRRQLLGTVAGRLHAYRRVLHDLVVVPAEQVPILLDLTVCLLRHAERGQVKRALLDVLGSRALPDGGLGFFHPDRLTFGEDVFLSRLIAAARGVPGVEHVHVNRLQRLGDEPNGEIEAGALRLGPNEIARLDNDANAPDNGVLLLTLKGGR